MLPNQTALTGTFTMSKNNMKSTTSLIIGLLSLGLLAASCTEPNEQEHTTETVLNLDNTRSVYNAGPALEFTTCDSASYHWMSCDSALHPGTKFVPSDTVLNLQGERTDLYNLLEITHDQELVVRDKKPVVDQVTPIEVVEEPVEQAAPSTNSDLDWGYFHDVILPWLLLIAGILFLIGLGRWAFSKDWNQHGGHDHHDHTENSTSIQRKRKKSDKFKIEHKQGEGANRTETLVEMRGKTIDYGVHVNIIVDGKKTAIHIDDNMEPYQDDEAPAGVQPPTAAPQAQ